MKFIHTADIHLGAEPDAGSSYTAKRPEELWNSFERLLNICEEEQTDLLLIAGDLFHRQPLLRELKELDYLFSRLTHTQVVLMAGNHDYLKSTSYYRNYFCLRNLPVWNLKSLGSAYTDSAMRNARSQNRFMRKSFRKKEE